MVWLCVNVSVNVSVNMGTTRYFLHFLAQDALQAFFVVSFFFPALPLVLSLHSFFCFLAFIFASFLHVSFFLPYGGRKHHGLHLRCSRLCSELRCFFRL